ncbi:MAG: hypothetical protein AABW79_04875 [Nanoarchaeota archaeon]
MNYSAFVYAVKKEIKDIKPSNKAASFALREGYSHLPHDLSRKDAQRYVEVFCAGYRGAYRSHMHEERVRISGLISRLRLGGRNRD